METYRGVVYPWEIDHMGHMNVQFYAAKFDSATWHLFGAIGMTPAWLREQSRGMMAASQTIEYAAELLAGDLIVVTSVINEISNSSIKFSHVMVNGATGDRAARTELVGVHMDMTDRSSCPFPESVRNRAREIVASEPGSEI